MKQLSTKTEVKTPVKNHPESTFSLRQHLQSATSQKVKKFQAFSLQDLKTVEAVSKAFQISENEEIFQCFQCDQKWTLNGSNWPEIVRHLVQKSGTFAKHLSSLVDQYLVILQTDQKTLSLTSVLKCRKCKFYLNVSTIISKVSYLLILISYLFTLQISKVENHACLKSARGTTCALCNTKHAGGPSEKCVRALTGALALHCKKSTSDNKAVIPNLKKEIVLKVANCFATITNAFNEDANDSIEELIVASKQQIL